MDLDQAVGLASVISEHIDKHLHTLWPGLSPVPFILYCDRFRVAAGGEFPPPFREIRPGIRMAEGKDPALMGNTAATHNGQMTALWDLRTWPDQPDPARAAASIAHEMFHAFQFSSFRLPFSNEMLLPQYPHTPESLSLVLRENELLCELSKSTSVTQASRLFSQIHGLRTARARLIGSDYFNYDLRVESTEGTAAYIEACMDAVLTNRMPRETARSILTVLQKDEDLLSRYRLRCYASGLALCLAAGTLYPGWKAEWTADLPLYDWLKRRMDPPETEPVPDKRLLAKSASLLSAYDRNREQAISAFLSAPLFSYEGDIALLCFDPLNIVCHGGRCLHKHGRIRVDGVEFLLEQPFLEEYDGTVIRAKKFIFHRDEKPI